MHTLVFRVERVLIVHRETGLLLREVAPFALLDDVLEGCVESEYR